MPPRPSSFEPLTSDIHGEIINVSIAEQRCRKIDVVLAFIRVHSFFFHTKIYVLRIRTL